jgi:hypothetical protein
VSLQGPKTKFLPVPGTPDGVRMMLDNCGKPLVLVSRHGLGDNVFVSPCFTPLRRLFGRLFFSSRVNPYTSLFHESDLVSVVYAGGVTGADLGLMSAEDFARHLDQQRLDLGVPEVLVYPFGCFEPHLPYSDERAFVKGRRNFVEMFRAGPSAAETPRYHVAPDRASKDYVATVIQRWLPDRELIVIGRYGHTDCDKNFGHDWRDTVQTALLLDRTFPERFKFVSLDYTPGDHAADGRSPIVRSVYGFLPCDAASMHHLLTCASLLICVPSGPMLVGATVPGLKLLTLWKTMQPFHYLDPQFAPHNPVHALVERPELASTSFMDGWLSASRETVLNRWRVRIAPVTPETVADEAVQMLRGDL